jgi:hypothetical protein
MLTSVFNPAYWLADGLGQMTALAAATAGPGARFQRRRRGIVVEPSTPKN